MRCQLRIITGQRTLIEQALPFTRQSRQEPTLLGWLKALPDELFQNHPVLNVHYAGTLMQNGQFDGVEARLRDIERWLAAPEDRRIRPVYVDEEGFSASAQFGRDVPCRNCPGSRAMWRMP
jgi:LuxR family maltose regulon positive regulatory protein